MLDACLAEVAAGNERLNAFVHLDEEQARAAADAVDAAVARGIDPGPFAGVPFGVKDLDDCAGMPTSHGSLVYKGRAPAAADSIHVARLRAAGGVPIGKTAAPEFGTLNFTKTKAWGITRNPWDRTRTPGGSSGGSAAAVAAGLVPVATASDGGGSTRIPAGFSGLVGLKPSHGRIPHPGPSGSQTAVHGMLTTTVADSARHLDITAGPHDDDRLSLPADGRRYEELIETLPVAGLRARWSVDLGFVEHVDPDVARVAEAAASALVGAAGLELDGKDVHLTDPVRTWLSGGAMDLWFSIDEDMWPAVADDLTRYSRDSLEATVDYPVRKYARAVRRREQLTLDASRAVRRGRCAAHAHHRGAGVPGRGPAARRGAGHPVHDARQPLLEPVDLRPRRPHQRRPARRPPDHRPPPPRRPRPAPGQDLRADQPLAARPPACPRSASGRAEALTALWRKRSTSSAIVSALGTVPGSSSWRSSRLAT